MTWRADGQRAKLSPSDRAAIEAERQRREIENQQKRRSAADKAGFIKNQSTPILKQEYFPYLVSKKIQPHGALLNVYQGRASMVIPIYNAKGQLVSLQFIEADGSKRFLPGGEIKGCFVGISTRTIGQAETGRILLCEGFATGASLYEWFQQPVIIAFNAGNLEPVAKQIRQFCPFAEIIVCGDNDESGVGQKAARAAALAVGGKYLLPPVVGQDFNDAINAWRDAASAEAVA
jgi:putative DNA primase/helicase